MHDAPLSQAVTLPLPLPLPPATRAAGGGQWAVGSEWLGPAVALRDPFGRFWSGYGRLGRLAVWPSELGDDTAPAEDWLPSPPAANPVLFAWLFASLPLPASIWDCLSQSASGTGLMQHIQHTSRTLCISVGGIPDGQRRRTTERTQTETDGDGDGAPRSEYH